VEIGKRVLDVVFLFDPGNDEVIVIADGWIEQILTRGKRLSAFSTGRIAIVNTVQPIPFHSHNTSNKKKMKCPCGDSNPYRLDKSAIGPNYAPGCSGPGDINYLPGLSRQSLDVDWIAKQIITANPRHPGKGSLGARRWTLALVRLR
jgi:hypothetical protein